MQTKKKSFIESLVNVFIGTLTSIVLGPIVYWIWNVPISIFQFGGVTITFLVISIFRNYIIRRYFNNL